MARRQLIRRMIGTSFSRAEDALAWAASRTLDALALVDVVRVEGPRRARELVRHPFRSVRAVPVQAPPGAPAEPEHLPEPTDPEFRLEFGHARVTTTSRGRKTVPISVAAARKARAKAEPKPAIKPRHGQKKKH